MEQEPILVFKSNKNNYICIMKKYIDYTISFLKDFIKKVKWNHFLTYLIIANLLTIFLTKASLNSIMLMNLLFFILLFLLFVWSKLQNSNKN